MPAASQPRSGLGRGVTCIVGLRHERSQFSGVGDYHCGMDLEDTFVDVFRERTNPNLRATPVAGFPGGRLRKRLLWEESRPERAGG